MLRERLKRLRRPTTAPETVAWAPSFLDAHASGPGPQHAKAALVWRSFARNCPLATFSARCLLLSEMSGTAFRAVRVVFLFLFRFLFCASLPPARGPSHRRDSASGDRWAWPGLSLSGWRHLPVHYPLKATTPGSWELTLRQLRRSGSGSGKSDSRTRRNRQGPERPCCEVIGCCPHEALCRLLEPRLVTFLDISKCSSPSTPLPTVPRLCVCCLSCRFCCENDAQDRSSHVACSCA